MNFTLRVLSGTFDAVCGRTANISVSCLVSENLQQPQRTAEPVLLYSERVTGSYPLRKAQDCPFHTEYVID